MEKKIAAGADYIITQLGYDVKKFRELKRVRMDERGLTTPVFGQRLCVGREGRREVHQGRASGSAGLRANSPIWSRRESKAADKGLGGRLERAAKTVAVLRGLGFAGAYLGGDHQADHIRWIIRRSEAIADKWEEYAEELTYAPKGGILFLRVAARSEEARALGTRRRPGGAGQLAETADRDDEADSPLDR